MALKRKITKAEYDKLSTEIKTEYVADGDDFKLDIAGEADEDTGALKRAKDREAQLRREAEKRAKEAEDKLAGIEGDDARKKGDIATLEKAWQKKLDDAKAEADAKISKYENNIRATLVDNVATKLAAEISTSPALILPHIKARLVADLDGDTPTTKVLGKDGKPSNVTLDDLRKEFVDNKDFATIIRASKASGGGAPDASQRTRLGGAPQTPTGDKPASLAALPAKDLAAQLKAAKEANAS